MNKKPIETIMGIVVLIIAGYFMYFAYNVSNLHVVKGYEVNAKFLKVGGLNVGSDIKVNGIKIGTITSQDINQNDFMVDVKMNILPNIKLPEDSSFQIAGDNLMGNKYIKVIPGKSSNILQNNSIASNTIDAKSLEDMIGEIIFMVTGNEK